MSVPARLAVVIAFSGDGGVERMVLNLAEGIAARGIEVDLVTIRQHGRHLRELPAAVRLVPLGTRHTATSLPALVRYLRARRPQALLVAKDRAIRMAVLARALAQIGRPAGSRPPRLVGRLGTTVSAALADAGALRQAHWRWRMRAFYPHVDRLVAVSAGVAEDVRTLAALPATQVSVVRNPVVTPRLRALGAAPAPHPWLQASPVPVVLGAGRLTAQKDFPTLLRAFAALRARQPARLIVIGEGPQRAALETLARSLGVADEVALPGFADNPYAYMRHASVFVLSSRWEGSPNVLTEALALGTPVVATDCPSGPAEILDGGRIAPLVPMQDPAALADAMARVLAAPPDPARLQAAVADYHVERSVEGYLQALHLAGPADR